MNTQDTRNAAGFGLAITLLALLLSGCAHTPDYGRQTRVANAFAGASVAMATRRQQPIPVCVCDTDYDCQTRCGGSY